MTRRSSAGYGAAVWSAIFAAMHFYWGAGGRLGLGPGADAAFRRFWFLMYDLAVGVICVLGAVVAVAVARHWAGRVWLALAWSGAVVLLLRGGGGLTQGTYQLITLGPAEVPIRLVTYDVWFLLGGFLFVAAIRRYRKEKPSQT